PGTAVTFSGHGTGCGASEQRFWLYPPGGPWQLVQDWGATTTWRWNTSGLGPGTYTVFVGVRSPGGTTAESSAQLDYVLGSSGCTGASLTPDLASPHAVGTKITFSASPQGCTSSEQRFSLLPPGKDWQLVQDWSSAKTWAWD